MLRLSAILVMILFARVSLADVCFYTTKEQAEIGADLLRINPGFVKYCAPCSDKSKTKVRAEKVEARAIGHDQYWGVFVNEENIDLAYTYLDIGEDNGISLAKLSGCEIPKDIPRMIDLTDVTTPTMLPSKQSIQLKAAAPDEDLFRNADQYFQKSDFAAALLLYEKLLEGNPSKSNVLTPKIKKCYYNLGVQTIRKASSRGSRKDCNLAADYFTQCLFLDEKDTLAREGLNIANVCKEFGPNLPKVQSEIDDLKLRE